MTTTNPELPDDVQPALTEQAPDVRSMTLVERVAAIHREMPSVPKTQQAPSQMGGFMFRGIEQVEEALNPLLGKYGVFYTQHVLDTQLAERQGANRVMFHTAVHLELTFQCDYPDDEAIIMDAWGEAVDTGDKGFGKANTNARKIALLSWLCLPTEDSAASDIDRHVVEETVPTPYTDDQHEHLAESITAARTKGHISDEELAALGRQYGRKEWPLDERTMAQAVKDVAELIAVGETGQAATDADMKPGEKPFDVVPGETEGYKDLWRLPPFARFNVPQLREECRKRQIEDDGQKDALVSRLNEHQASHLGDVAAQAADMMQRKSAEATA